MKDNKNKTDNNKGTKMKKWLIALLVFLGLILVAAAILGYFAYLGSQDDSIQVNEKNTDLYAALVAAGINDAVVDITDERVLVSYNLPKLDDKEAYIYFTLGATSKLSHNSKEIIITEFSDLKAFEEVTVSMEDVKSFSSNTISEEEFMAKWKVSKIN